jgi:hypothetical protein
MLVAHTCKPSYLGGRDQEKSGSKPAQANNSHQSLSQIYPTQKKAGRVPA